MAQDPSNGSNSEQLALKGLISINDDDTMCSNLLVESGTEYG